MTNEFKWYRATIKHDNGRDIINLTAQSEFAAIMLLQATQCCPKSAIVRLKEIKNPKKHARHR